MTVDATTPDLTSSPICVVGAGTMGRGIAQIAIDAGHIVTLVDPDQEQLDSAVAEIVARLERRRSGARTLVEQQLHAVRRVEHASPAADTVVIEAVVEQAAVKQTVFEEALAHFGDTCVLATNTSSLSITEIAASTDAPSRVVGMHFFNPVPAMKLVEVVHGLQTDPALAEAVAKLAVAWGKHVARVRSAPGFIVNRVARSFYGEALKLVEEGTAELATVDTVMRLAGRFRMGPFELMDLIGVEVNLAVSRTVWASYQFDPRFAPSLLQTELVAAGRFGRKTGRGFYDHSEGTSRALAEPSTTSTAAPSDLARVGKSVQLETLLARAGCVADVRDADGGPPRIEVPGRGVVVLTRGRTGQQEAAELGMDVAVLDRCLDPSGADGLALASTSAGIREAAVALLSSAGIAAYPVADTPGLVVARILAMIANEAWDAVGHGIASPADVDTAMVLGTNYPSGPFAWTETWGVEEILGILDALADEYRDPRYRASQHLRAAARQARR